MDFNPMLINERKNHNKSNNMTKNKGDKLACQFYLFVLKFGGHTFQLDVSSKNKANLHCSLSNREAYIN